MRNPFRTEAEAFSFVLVCVGLFAAVAVAGILGGGWVALAVFLVLAVGVAVLRRRRAEGRRARPSRPRRRRRRATASSSSRTRPSPAARCAARSCAGRSATPTCSSSAPRSTRRSATGPPTRTAPARRPSAGWTSRSPRSPPAGVEARGEVGDADPIQAMDDALRTFGADEIVISTHPPGRSNWLEKEVIARARERYAVPDHARGRRPRARELGAAERRGLALASARSEAPVVVSAVVVPLVAARVAALDVLPGDARDVGGHVDRVLARDEVGRHRRPAARSICPRTTEKIVSSAKPCLQRVAERLCRGSARRCRSPRVGERVARAAARLLEETKSSLPLPRLAPSRPVTSSSPPQPATPRAASAAARTASRRVTG